MRVTSRNTTASGPPERASSRPASTSAERTVPRGRGPRRAVISPSGGIVTESLVDTVHKEIDGMTSTMEPRGRATEPHRPRDGRRVALLSRLADFLHANARRVLAVAVLAAAVAG